MDSSDLSDGAVTLQEYLELKKALAASEAKVQQLMKVNSSLSDELRRLQREVRMASEPCWAGKGRCCPGFLPLPEAAVLPGVSDAPLTLRSTSCRPRTCRSGSRQGQCPHPLSPASEPSTPPWDLAGAPTAGTARRFPCMNQALP